MDTLAFVVLRSATRGGEVGFLYVGPGQADIFPIPEYDLPGRWLDYWTTGVVFYGEVDVS